MLLSIEDASVHYQKVAALKSISLAVDERSIVTIIGANGAGKTTTLRAISGLVKLSTGSINFAGEPKRLKTFLLDQVQKLQRRTVWLFLTLFPLLNR
jgi:ABC-type branched-subunit amino acid transport system ATPase component